MLSAPLFPEFALPWLRLGGGDSGSWRTHMVLFKTNMTEAGVRVWAVAFDLCLERCLWRGDATGQAWCQPAPETSETANMLSNGKIL